MHSISIPSDVRAFVSRRSGGVDPYAQLDPETTALVVVDMQNFFMADGEMGCCVEARDIVPNINRLAYAVRGSGGLVAWIQNGAAAELMQGWANLEELYTEEKAALRRERMRPGCEAFELWSDLDVRENDARVVKSRYSAFAPGASELETVLQQRGIENVLVVGVATNVCCESTARDAMMRGYRTLMVSDATATFTDAEHNAALITFMKFFGEVQPTDTVLARLQR
ncbi:MAG: isochorismatase family cysteine hydrolase [Aquisalimonadaceae bacterium]